MYSEGSAETLREVSAGEEAVLGNLQTFRGYRVWESLPSSGAESDIHVIDCGGERRILKLYRLGIEPKLEVLQKVETLSRKHPEDLVRIHEKGDRQLVRNLGASSIQPTVEPSGNYQGIWVNSKYNSIHQINNKSLRVKRSA